MWVREINLKLSLLRKEGRLLQVLLRKILLKIPVRTPKKKQNRGWLIKSSRLSRTFSIILRSHKFELSPSHINIRRVSCSSSTLSLNKKPKISSFMSILKLYTGIWLSSTKDCSNSTIKQANTMKKWTWIVPSLSAKKTLSVRASNSRSLNS
jgi:hypothetical protein